MTRTATIGDNNPPEEATLRVLVGADEIEAEHKTAIDKRIAETKAILDTYERIPDDLTEADVYGRVVSVVARMRQIASDTEDDKKTAKRPYLDVNNKLEDLFKLKTENRALGAELAKAIKDLTERLSKRDTAEYRLRKADLEREARQLAEAARKDGIEMDDLPANVEMASITSPHGGISMREVVKTWQVTDEAALPRSVLSIDPKKVEALLASGATAITGLEIGETVSTIVKRR